MFSTQDKEIELFKLQISRYLFDLKVAKMILATANCVLALENYNATGF